MQIKIKTTQGFEERGNQTSSIKTSRLILSPQLMQHCHKQTMHPAEGEVLESLPDKGSFCFLCLPFTSLMSLFRSVPVIHQEDSCRQYCPLPNFHKFPSLICFLPHSSLSSLHSDYSPPPPPRADIPAQGLTSTGEATGTNPRKYAMTTWLHGTTDHILHPL